MNTSNEDAVLESVSDTEISTSHVQPAIALPQRILCENPGEIFIILKEEIPITATVDIEFCSQNKHIRTQPTQWNEKILSLKALEFPVGPVSVNICCDGVIRATTEIEYYTAVGEIELLLKKVTDPIAFICQAFKVYTLEDLDIVLMKSLQSKISSCEFNLHEINQHTNRKPVLPSEEMPVPTPPEEVILLIMNKKKIP
ncbi:B-cell scaffold protein with ankyrin repeats-like [Discoglossus pictus]